LLRTFANNLPLWMLLESNVRTSVSSFVAFFIIQNMANSKYEYVKSFEVEDEVMFPNLIIIRIDGRDFSR